VGAASSSVLDFVDAIEKIKSADEVWNRYLRYASAFGMHYAALVDVPGPGDLAMAGKNVKPQRTAHSRNARVAVSAAGPVTLKIKAKGKAKKKLKQKGKAKLKLSVTYTPTGGAANTQAKTVKLKKTAPKS